jgi:hypothetical protein
MLIQEHRFDYTKTIEKQIGNLRDQKCNIILFLEKFFWVPRPKIRSMWPVAIVCTWLDHQHLFETFVDVVNIQQNTIKNNL